MSLPSTSPTPAPQSPPLTAESGVAAPASPAEVQLPAAEGSSATAGANTTATTQAKRKPSRRANTAERRATHNAVERARRETLNGRFLDLAALLPNLSQIRRPSKSSIVNSSIAHIHASRRHRAIAARELRLLKLEADALRRELNEWRDRSGLPRVEEPVRGEAFQMILSGEVEILSAGPIEEEDEGEFGDEFGSEEFAAHPVNVVPSMAEDQDDLRHPSMAHAAAAALLKSNPDANPFAHNTSHGHPGLHLQTILPRPSGAPSPMIVQSPSNVSFENPAMANIYEPQYYMGMPRQLPVPQDEKAWNMFPQQQFTPPQSSHGSNVPPQQQQYLMNMQRQAMLHAQTHGAHPVGHMYGSPVDGDDASSVGSSPIPGAGANVTKRERSGSMGSVGSVGSGSFEMPNVLAANNGIPRRMTGPGTNVWDENIGMSMGGGLAVGMSGMMGRGGQQPISVGGGGNAHGFAAMMV